MNRRNIILVGPGRVGRAFAAQHTALGGAIAALVDRSGWFTGDINQALAHKEAGGALSELGAAPGTDADWPDPPGVLVDASDGDTLALWDAAWRRGWAVVSANKGPLAAHDADWPALRARWLEGRLGLGATVGAGVPSARALRTIVLTGDRITAIEGVLSGTMSAVLGELGSGTPLSDAVRGAHAAGYTEPDPVLDLCGKDVGRKISILAQLAGFGPDIPRVHIEPLVNAGWIGLELDELVARLGRLDRVWRARAESAARSDRVLRYVAHARPGALRCGLRALPRAEGLGRLASTENGVCIYSERYGPLPLTLMGPGMGPAVTAWTLVEDAHHVVTGHGAKRP